MADRTGYLSLLFLGGIEPHKDRHKEVIEKEVKIQEKRRHRRWEASLKKTAGET